MDLSLIIISRMTCQKPNIIYANSFLFFLVHISHVNGTYDELQCLQIDSTAQRFCMFSVRFTNCGKKLLAGGNDGCVYMYDRELNRRTRQIGVASVRLISFAAK